MIGIGEIIKIKGQKRLCMEVVQKEDRVSGETTLNCVMRYNAAPKSRLKKKTVFSKVKIKVF